MKKINILLAMFAVLTFWSCEPLEDELDVVQSNFTIAKSVTYTLSEDDYESTNKACKCVGSESFSSLDSVKKYVPSILADEFPSLGFKSTAIVTYNFNIGSFEGIDAYTAATGYTVSGADYASVSTEAGDDRFFNPLTKAKDYLPAILSTSISGSAEGEIRAVSYNYSDFRYSEVEYFLLYEEDFESLDDLSGFETSDSGGDQGWELYASSSGYQAARMSGFDDGAQPNEDWFILPNVDLTSYNDAVLTLSHVVNFLGDGEYGTHLSVKASTNFVSGTDPLLATWSDLTLDKWPAGDSYDIETSAISLAGFGGAEVTLAFYYKSTADFAPQWRIVSTEIAQGEPFETTTKKEFYSFDGSAWEAIDEDVYFLSSADYDAMGAPGRFNNFSSSTPADNYLPQFLKSFLPFAQDGDEQVIVYDYFSSSSGAQVRGDYYTFSGGAWNKYESIVENTFGFGHNGTVWEPDNTINISLDSDDYAAIAVATELSNPDGSASVGQYSNFDLGLWSPSQIFDAITTRLADKVPSVNDQKYRVTYATWEPGAGSGSIHVVYSDADSKYIPVPE